MSSFGASLFQRGYQYHHFSLYFYSFSFKTEAMKYLATLAFSLLAGATWAAPIGIESESAVSTPFNGTGKIYGRQDGETYGCMDLNAYWTTEDSCATFTAHHLPGGFWLSTTDGSSTFTCQATSDNGELSCGIHVDGDTTFQSDGSYLAYGDSEPTLFWAQNVPRDAASASPVAAKSDRTVFTVPVKFFWVAPTA